MDSSNGFGSNATTLEFSDLVYAYKSWDMALINNEKLPFSFFSSQVFIDLTCS